MRVQIETPNRRDAQGTVEATAAQESGQTGVIHEQDLLDYLLYNPGFFERHATSLAQIRLISPHGKRAVSLQERQAEILRERIKQLERQLMQLIRNGNENGVIAERLLQWAEDLLGLPSVIEREAQMAALIAQRFSVPQAVLQLWRSAQISLEVQSWVNSLTEPYCGLCPQESNIQSVLPRPEEAACLAVLPLRSDRGDCFGALIFASPDAERFHSGMATDFLQRIAAMAARALQV